METQADRTVTYPARIDWWQDDTFKRWNDHLARIVEVFGLPGDRYRTRTEIDFMDFIFFNEQDRLLFLTGWPAFIPKEDDEQ